jgi:hypothetical protein
VTATKQMSSNSTGHGVRVEAAWHHHPPKLHGGRSLPCSSLLRRRQGREELQARPLRLCVVSLQGWQPLSAETTVWELLAVNCFCCSLPRLRKRQKSLEHPTVKLCGNSLCPKSFKGLSVTVGLSSHFWNKLLAKSW